MTDVYRGSSNTLVVEWRSYAGGPYAAVTGVSITITPLVGGSPVLAQTTTGVTYPSTGINVYVWTPSGALDPGSYLVEWSGTDTDLETVGAAEIVTVLAGGALGGPYATAAALKERMSIPDSNVNKDNDIASALASASDSINRWCGRQFGQATEVSSRTYAAGPSGVDTDDFWTTDGLTIDGTAYDVSSLTYALLPNNGLVDGVTGWPYYRIAVPGTYSGLSWPWASSVAVVAKWGWPTIPAGITEACLLLAADSLKSADAPFGVAGFGDYVVRVRANPKAAEKLAPYVRDPIKVA